MNFLNPVIEFPLRAAIVLTGVPLNKHFRIKTIKTIDDWWYVTYVPNRINLKEGN